MSRYAESTTVGSDRSRAEIERVLARYGATSFMYGWDQQTVIVGFVANGRQVRFKLPMPDREMHFMLPNGQTVGEWAVPQIDAVYETGQMPSLLPGAQRAIEA